MIPDTKWKSVPKVKTYDPRGVLVHTFESVGAAVDNALLGPQSGTPTQTYGPGVGYASHDERGTYSWDFGTDWNETVRLAREGWPEGRENVEALAATIRESIANTSMGSFERAQVLSSVAGSMVNVPAFIAGVPEAMFTWEPVEIDSPIVHVVIESSTSAVISAEFYSTRGSAVCALIDLLESSGRRCEVTLVDSIWADGVYCADIRTTLKRPGDPLLIDSLAMAIAHPAYFRRIGFAHIEDLPNGMARKVTHSAYGQPTGTRFDRGDVYIPVMHIGDREWANQLGARAWVMNRLRECGVEIEGA